MSNEQYKGLRIAVSNAAMRELMKYEKTVRDVVEILEDGIDAPIKRKEGTIEKWLNKGAKTWNAVIVKDYHEILQGECWVLIHFGQFTKR